MDWSNIAAFAATEFLLCLSPGPAVLLVVGLSMRQGFWRSQAAAAGILTTNAVYFALSAAGVASLILASATLFYVLKIVGAAYLAWLGLGMILPLWRAWRSGEKGDVPLALAAEASPRLTAPPRKLYWKGISVQAANPKNLAFFVAILPQFIDPNGPVALQMVVLGIVSVLLELPVLLIYALTFSALAKLITQRLVMWIEAFAGVVLIGLAGPLALERKPL